ncbi:MAG TPA: TonB-dependent receptor [Bacteroidia bacterium]|nr:TonB-dependent receptor [Bacteroidia bacterium]HMU18627.1 TonB-dependent receptor [Bacteroidia bacterium]
MKRFFALAYLFLGFTLAFAQNPTQTVRGTITDKQSKEPLIGASIVWLDSSAFIGATADINGNFRLNNIPVGRQSFKISFLGYRETVITSIITSGKEVLLNIELEQSVVTAKAVTIVAEKQKDKPNNELTTVSARSFTIEETSRYAGSVGDPSRMAANYAGVSGANDSRNDIIIRGNSPTGLLWRLNGVEIPNPNHFGSLGTTGGPISILNNNVLDKSDFLTGAFPAEYGNVLAGVFDLQMRTGNNEKDEFLAQVGFNGFEAGAEGPISKKQGSSYLVNYRYSTLGVFSALGINFGTGTAVPKYQDVSFNVNLPTNKAGKFTLFGMGGISGIEVLEKDRDTTKKNLYVDDKRQNGYFDNTMGVVGLMHTFFLNNSTYTKFSISASIAGQKYKVDTLPDFVDYAEPYYRNKSDQQKYSADFSLNKKFSSKNFLKTGFSLSQYHYTYRDSGVVNNVWESYTDYNGNALLTKLYLEWQHRFSDQLSLNSGVYSQIFNYNNTYSIEPRIGAKWEINEKQSLSFGTGLHSQLQPMYIYFVKTLKDNGSYYETNQNLKMTKSYHAVLAFDRNISKVFRIKTEVYYQYLFNAPVEKRPTFFSVLNEGADFGIAGIDSLENKGTGYNYGFEFTAEKFYSKGYYFLFTASLFESKYKGSDGIERNTAFNGNFVFNLLGGKEWTIRNKNTISINIKTTYAGGRRYIPIDFAASQIAGETEYDEDHAFEHRRKDYFRTDLKIGYRINRKRLTHEITIDLNNVFNTQNIWNQQYSAKTNTVKTEYQMGFLPIPMYKCTF